MITHTSDSHQLPSQNKTKSKLQILKIAKNSNFEFFQETLHTTHLLKWLDKMYKYEMDPTKTVGTTEWTRDAGRADGRTDGWRADGRTDRQSETNIPPQGCNDMGASWYDSYLDTEVTIQYVSRYVSKHSNMSEGRHEKHESRDTCDQEHRAQPAIPVNGVTTTTTAAGWLWWFISQYFH